MSLPTESEYPMTAAQATHKMMIRTRRLAEVEQQIERAERLIAAPTTAELTRSTLVDYVDTLNSERTQLRSLLRTP